MFRRHFPDCEFINSHRVEMGVLFITQEMDHRRLSDATGGPALCLEA
jgi:hypothetical protein